MKALCSQLKVICLMLIFLLKETKAKPFLVKVSRPVSLFFSVEVVL